MLLGRDTSGSQPRMEMATHPKRWSSLRPLAGKQSPAGRSGGRPGAGGLSGVIGCRAGSGRGGRMRRPRLGPELVPEPRGGAVLSQYCDKRERSPWKWARIFRPQPEMAPGKSAERGVKCPEIHPRKSRTLFDSGGKIPVFRVKYPRKSSSPRAPKCLKSRHFIEVDGCAV